MLEIPIKVFVGKMIDRPRILTTPEGRRKEEVK